ncbi:hypothetical protein DBV08_18355 [Rhodococcus sp. KBW08]|nr:hypothetical protein DBV08_18355 [Rhodococcus sp. KBW08]
MGLEFESQGLAGYLLALTLLAFVRLLSDWPSRAEKLADNRPRKESLMGSFKQFGVVFTQKMLETIWTCGAGVLAAHWLT